MLWIEPLVMAGYGWLWLVMRFSLVLGTEFELSVAVQEGAGPITSLWARLLPGRRQRPLPAA